VKLIGLTGGIGSGKSEVARLLREKAVKVIDADSLAKEIAESDSRVREELIQQFGEGVYSAEGRLNRKALAEIIFRDPRARQTVESIVHPRVLQAIRDKVTSAEGEEGLEVAIVEAALVYESGLDHQLDAVAVVNAPLEACIQRTQKRDGLSREQVLQRLAAQMPLEEKVRRANYVIENDGSLEELAQRVEEFYRWLTTKVRHSDSEPFRT